MLLPFLFIFLYLIGIIPSKVIFWKFPDELPVVFYLIFCLYMYSSQLFQKFIYHFVGYPLRNVNSIISIIFSVVLLYFLFKHVNNNYLFPLFYILFCAFIGADKKFNNPSKTENIIVSSLRYSGFIIVLLTKFLDLYKFLFNLKKV